MPKPYGQQDYGDDPSPAEIRQACLDIQSTWTPGDERQRRTGSSSPEPYELSPVKTPRERF